MNAANAIVLPEWLADAAGPIVVKEVRQGLRAKVFAVSFGLLLFACLVGALFAGAEVSKGRGVLGPNYLAVFFAAQSTVCLFVIPITAYRSMAREREEETWALLTLTGLSARRIVRGKVASSFVQSLLYTSCCAPFVLFSYYLNGVDLVTLVLGVALTLCACALLVCAAVALGTEGVTRFGRAATRFFTLALLLGFTFLAIVFGVVLAKEGSNWVRDPEFWASMAALAFAFLSSAWILLEAASANLALTSELNMAPVRIAIAVQHVTAVVASYVTVVFWRGPAPDVAAVASLVSSFTLGVTGFFLVSESDGLPSRWGWKSTWTTPGALRGWRLLMALLAFDTAGWLGLYAAADREREQTLVVLLAAPAYAGLYGCVGATLGRTRWLARLGTKLGARVGFLGSMIAASVFLPVASAVFGGNFRDPMANCLNPVFGLVDFSRRYYDIDGSAFRLSLLWVVFLASAVPALHALARNDTGCVG